MYDEFVKTLEELRKLSDDERSKMMTWFVLHFVLMFVRYVITGIVAFLLGRRIINAFAFSMKAVRDEEKAKS